MDHEKLRAWLEWYGLAMWATCRADHNRPATHWPSWIGPKAIALARGEKV